MTTKAKEKITEQGYKIIGKEQTKGFATEVKQLLKLVINSLYSNKEIFLRELVSNASDACDKLRFEALGNDKLFEKDHDLNIKVEFDTDARTITITDNGIGMSQEEVVNNIGTIAHSGTAEFLQALQSEQAKYSNLIGQFGVGFYSAFIVADEITVITRRAGLKANEGVIWHSKGEGDYTLGTVEKPTRGTEIILHIKEEDEEFLSEWKLRSIITKYSDHIAFPVLMEKPEEPASDETAEDADFKEVDEEGKEKETAKKEEKKEEKQGPEFEAVNRATALWTESKNKITDEEYKELYKHIAHDYDEPLSWAHNKVEGKLEYTSVLYIPKRPQVDLWDRSRRYGLKLYVQRVFIMDEAEQFLPAYLRFARGIIDSNDLPLNVSREILQDNKDVTSMKNALTKRLLTMLKDMSEKEPEKYAEFWQACGQTLKEGPVEDMANKEKVAELLRFASTEKDSPEQSISFKDYIGRMKEGQKEIYYVSAETFNAAQHSPHLEIFRKKGIEVLLLSDHVDEWLMGHLTEFDGKKLQSVAKGELDLGDLEDQEDKKQQEKVTEDSKELTAAVKEALSDNVKDVKVTTRLTNSPSCIVSAEDEMSLQMQRLLKSAGQPAMETKPILELNPEHKLVKNLASDLKQKNFKEWCEILLDQAILAEGGKLKDPTGFVSKVNDLSFSK